MAALPKILNIHLNRFDLDYETMNRRKLNNKVTFPFILNMNKFLKPFEEIAEENSKDPSNKSIDISDIQKIQETIRDEEVWLNFQNEAFGQSDKKGRKKPAVTYEDYEDFLSKKVISTDKSHSGLNLMVPSKVDAMSVGDQSLNQSEQKALALETLASLKQSKKELDKKLNKLQRGQVSLNKNNIPLPKTQIDMDDLTILEMVLLSQNDGDTGPKSTEDTTSKSVASDTFGAPSEKVRNYIVSCIKSHKGKLASKELYGRD